MPTFEFKNAQELARVFARHEVRYLFFGKSGAILLGFSDTTKTWTCMFKKRAGMRRSLRRLSRNWVLRLTEKEQDEVRRGKDFIQLRNGPFDLDLIFAPDGIERFEDAWKRHAERDGLPVASLDDIIASKRAANRQRDRESLPRLLSFRDWLRKKEP